MVESRADDIVYFIFGMSSEGMDAVAGQAVFSVIETTRGASSNITQMMLLAKTAKIIKVKGPTNDNHHPLGIMEAGTFKKLQGAQLRTEPAPAKSKASAK
jgi:hypothetical protein